MFTHVNRDNGTIELTATGSDDMSLLRRFADGVHVQAFDDSRSYCNRIVLTPKLIAEEHEEKQDGSPDNQFPGRI